jgi:hypothetical protein
VISAGGGTLATMNRIPARLKNGIAVPDQPVPLPDGTAVVIEIPAVAWLQRFVGLWRDDPEIEAFARAWPQERTASEGPRL